jgi:hypothetical protein
MILYISGPFSAPDDAGIERNIAAASDVALDMWRAGWSVISPHKNTAGFQHAQDLTHDRWMLGDFEILRKCDAVLMLPGWSQSRGAILEHRYAGDLGLPTFYHPQQAADWLSREQPLGHCIEAACDLIRTQHFIEHQDLAAGGGP